MSCTLIRKGATSPRTYWWFLTFCSRFCTCSHVLCLWGWQHAEGFQTWFGIQQYMTLDCKTKQTRKHSVFRVCVMGLHGGRQKRKKKMCSLLHLTFLPHERIQSHVDFLIQDKHCWNTTKLPLNVFADSWLLKVTERWFRHFFNLIWKNIPS